MILRLFQIIWKNGERAGPGGEGDVIDHFSASAIDHYLSKFDEAFKGKDISYLRYYFNDVLMKWTMQEASQIGLLLFLTNSKNIGDMTCVSTYLHC